MKLAMTPSGAIVYSLSVLSKLTPCHRQLTPGFPECSVRCVWGCQQDLFGVPYEMKKGVDLLAKENRALSRTITHREACGGGGLKPGICTTSNLKVDSKMAIMLYAI